MRKTFVVYFVSTVFLGLMFLMAWTQIVIQYLNYGLSYEVVSIVKGVQKVEVHNVYGDVFGLVFLGWLIILLGYATHKFKYARSIQEDHGFEEKTS